jgi:hypothetical protein
MFSCRYRLACVLGCLIGGVSLGLPVSAAEPGRDFRVENRVYREAKKQPLSRSTTIFHQGAVYDFLAEPAEVIVFEPEASRFVLLDTARRVRCELTTRQVETFIARLQETAAEQDDPFWRFLAAPELTERFDAATGELSLSSPWISYRVLTAELEGSSVANRYREFADWYAKLNTMLHPGSNPPSARLTLNVALARRNLVPKEVHLTMTPKRSLPPRRLRLRSEHQIVVSLSVGDLDRVAQASEFMQIYRQVGFQDYRRNGG